MTAAERAAVLTPAQMAAARSVGLAARHEVGSVAVRRAVRHLERVAGGRLRPECTDESTPDGA